MKLIRSVTHRYGVKFYCSLLDRYIKENGIREPPETFIFQRCISKTSRHRDPAVRRQAMCLKKCHNNVVSKVNSEFRSSRDCDFKRKMFTLVSCWLIGYCIRRQTRWVWIPKKFTIHSVILLSWMYKNPMKLHRKCRIPSATSSNSLLQSITNHNVPNMISPCF